MGFLVARGGLRQNGLETFKHDVVDKVYCSQNLNLCGALHQFQSLEKPHIQKQLF
jgi:hypothetical protein